MQAAPMARLQQGKQAAVTTGTPNNPAFPARWLSAYNVLPPVSGYLMHTSDSAGSISATINVSHQSHLLRLRRYLTAQSGCSQLTY
jgi:hypothetical protein